MGRFIGISRPFRTRDAVAAALAVAIGATTLYGCATPSAASETTDYGIVASYTDAYNDRDLERMSDLMHPDIQWLSVEGSAVVAIADGKDDLVRQMTDYMQSPSTTVSELEGLVADGSFRAVREIARWTREDGSSAEQSALAIYEIDQGLVRRIWYFPATQ